ncbi:Lar family restriction alleviation protein [Burkholderia gladioli]|uniref:Lar family restriction alleviation protein n=1 Tax=Burkholderia gladioli TaxID=28095 RepID=UPI0011B24BAA|nr:Lar family restriction alleviation protein [Burkholderia gladioli]
MSDKLSDESLPCPFCGCTDISEGEVLTDNPDGGASTQSMCRGCGALGPDAHLREGEVDFGSVKSTAAWNRRASPAPAITMPPLNDAMRAVLTNENCIYGTPDELYAALVKAAPAISESEDAARLNWLDTTNKRFRMGWSAGVAPAGNCRLQSIIQPDGNLTSVREAIDAARKGEKS